MRGAVNMARVDGDYNSADTQFSIMFEDQPHLDGRMQAMYQPSTDQWCTGQYTLWGHILAGMPHVDAITRGEPPEEPDTILSMRLVADGPGKLTLGAWD